MSPSAGGGTGKPSWRRSFSTHIGGMVSVEWVGVKIMKSFHGEDSEMHTDCLGNQKWPGRLTCRAPHKAGEAGASWWPE